MIRLAFGSVADIAIIPMQDVLGLDSSARMNIPGKAEGNWGWRFRPGQLTPEVKHRLAEVDSHLQPLEWTDTRGARSASKAWTDQARSSRNPLSRGQAVAGVAKKTGKKKPV